MQKRNLSTHCLPRFAAGTFAVFGATVLIVAALTASTQPAAAQQGFGNFFSYQGPSKKRVVRKRRAPAGETSSETAATTPAGDKKAAPEKAASEKTGPKGSVYAIISLPDQHITVYDATGRIARSRVSTGQAGHRTPSGVFSVIGKEPLAPLEHLQRRANAVDAAHHLVGRRHARRRRARVSGFARLHPPSGRLRAADVRHDEDGRSRRRYPRDIEPVEFSHPLLPLPKMQTPPAMPAGSQQAAAPASAVELASTGDAPSTTAAVPEAPAPTASAPALNPIAYAGALKARAAADKQVADQAAKEALAAAQAAGAEARQAADDVRKAEAAVAAAEAQISAIDARMAAPVAQPVAAAPTTAGATTDAADKTAAQSELTRAQAAVESRRARARPSSRPPHSLPSKRGSAPLPPARQPANSSTRPLAVDEQVSVFISKKEGRIFIRQDWKEVWEAPVTFRDPDRPLGTHIFTAIDAAPDGSSIRWTAISMPPESHPAEAKRTGSKGKPEEPTTPAPGPETAAGALDRIELPEGARERISELLWTGGSLIVSDNPRSGEMSEYSDFIVLTR